MLKTKIQKLKNGNVAQRILLLGIVFVLAGGFTVASRVAAETLSDQITRLQEENAQYNQEIEKLEGQAVNYQDAIAKLEGKISYLQQKINANKKEQTRLKQEIAAAEQELAEQKDLLGQNIKAMYLEGQISTLEILASSNDLSEFVDKEQYRSSVEDQIKDTLDRINELKSKLKTQKAAVEELLAQQIAKQNELASSQRKQQELLSFNQSQQDEFNRKTEANAEKIAELIAQQRAANISTDGGYYFLRFPGKVKTFNPASYPYRNSAFSMRPGPCLDGDGPDSWGYCYRQCVSYAAWAVLASGRDAPMYYGNAREWVAEAYAHGIPVHRTPKRGDIAISTSGYWGHAMYVESVSGDSFTTSEYNSYLNGKLHYLTRSY